MNARRILRQPLTAALIVGMLLSTVVVKLLESQLESEGRAKMQAALVLVRANLSVDTIRSKAIGVASILGLNEPILKEAALGRYELDAPEVIERLAIARTYFNYEGLYVIDKRGIMVANDTDGKKSTGKSIFFRPYFQQAIGGKESVYVAVGTNSDTRGIYYAAPLYDRADRRSNIIGVIAIKSSGEFLDGLLKQFGDDSLLISPQGVVYAATRAEWLWTLTPPYSAGRVEEIRVLKQFGMRFEHDMPRVLDFDPSSQNIQLNGDRYAAERVALDLKDPQGEWTLVRLKKASLWFPAGSKLKLAAAVWALALLAGIVLQRQRSFRIDSRRKLAVETAERMQAENAVLEAARSGEALAGLTAAMREAETFEGFSLRFFPGLATLLGIRYGVLYVADEVNRTLKVCGGYGVADAGMGTLMPYGTGLAGQCAFERQPIKLNSPPEDYIRIVSGTGLAKPAYLLLRPLLLNDALVGVVELAGLSEIQDRQMEILEELEPVAASCMEIIERKQRFHEQFVKQLNFQQALIDSIPNPIFYKGPDTRFLGCNQAYEKSFNVQKQDFIGKRVLDLEYIPRGERMAYQKEDERVIAHQETVKRMVTLRYADGKLRSCMYWVTAFSLEDGVKGGLVGTFIEIDMEDDDSIYGLAAVGQES